MNFEIVIYTLGRVIQFQSLFLLLPALVGLIYRENTGISFLLMAGVCMILSALCTLHKPKNKAFYAREGFVVVSLSWILLGVLGAIPFVLNGEIPNLVNAIFETVSGFTTTGASILTDVESLSHASLFWRSFTHWVGGMGVLVFILTVIPLAGAQNIYLIRAESPGPSVGKLVPKIKQTAKVLYGIYLAMTLVEVVLLLIGGLDLFSSLTMSFGTAGTGGFGILNSSAGEYSSYVQIILTIFMLLFGVNFNVYYLILVKKYKQAFHCEEVRYYFGIVLFAIIMITWNVYKMFPNFFTALKHVAFTVASIITTTGFSSTDFDLWPEFSKSILLLLMFVGACAGSTGGGIKVSRIVLYFKTVKKGIEQAIHPKSIKIVKFEGKQVEHEVIRGINIYLIAFLGILSISVLLVSLDNFGFITNFSAVVATINNIGPGFEVVGPTGNFSQFSIMSKTVLIFDMLAGRLEIFPLLILFARETWKS